MTMTWCRKFLAAGAGLFLGLGSALAYSLPDFTDPQALCHDREREPYVSVVDSHLRFLPSGEPGIPFAEIMGYLDRSGVRFVNVYGMGQTLPAEATCVNHRDCPDTPVPPKPADDIVSALGYLQSQPSRVHVTLSKSFPDLERPETLLAALQHLDTEFPGLFRWAGEVNLINQGLFRNGHKVPSLQTLQQAAPFMEELRRRGMPLTIHADLGNTEHPVMYRKVIDQFLEMYPENKIVWTNMGLSRELVRIDPSEHIAIMEDFLQRYPNLAIDLQSRMLDDLYFSKPDIRAPYIGFLNRHSMRILQGTGFVGSSNKNFDVYREELEAASRINRYLSDEAFRNIALGESYFRYAGLPHTAPRVCAPRPSLQSVLDDAHARFASVTDGQNADYIPELSSVSSDLFGLAIVTQDGQVYVAGDADHRFSIQSVSKPFVAALAMQTAGIDTVRRQVGVEATGFPFNSVEAIALQANRPGNPLVNAGAIATVSVLPSTGTEGRFESILKALSAFAGEPLSVIESVYQSEAATNQGNLAIAQLLAKYGRIYADPIQTLDVYTRQCAIGTTTRHLAVMGATLANRGMNPVSGERVVDAAVVPPVLALMSTAGFYDESGLWNATVGLPAKTGVGGGVVAVAPGQMAIAAFSPRLNAAGNSVRASLAIEYISRQLGLGMYGVPGE